MSKKIEQENYNQLKNIAFDQGAALFGVADLKKYKACVCPEIEPLLEEFPYAISIGVELSWAVLNTISNSPTLIYSWHYRQINTLLDSIALNLSRFIQSQNYLSLPIAASQVVDWKQQKAHISHKHLAVSAGLGYIGRNNLLVNEKYGSGLRLVSMLTSMPLIVDKPKEYDCEDCHSCVSVCPVGAIKEKPEDFKHTLCYEKLKEFSKMAGVKYCICGICIKACLGKATSV